MKIDYWFSDAGGRAQPIDSAVVTGQWLSDHLPVSKSTSSDGSAAEPASRVAPVNLSRPLSGATTLTSMSRRTPPVRVRVPQVAKDPPFCEIHHEEASSGAPALV